MANYEGHKEELQIKEAVYRIDARKGAMELVTDEGYKPNGICFSPDYKKLYIADTGGPEPRGIDLYEIVDGKKLAGRKRFCSMATTEADAEGARKNSERSIRVGKGAADGIRCDTD